MDISEVADYLGITKGAVRDAVSRGKLAVIRRGGTAKRAGYLLIERTEAERYKAENHNRRGFASESHPLFGKGNPREKAE